MTDADLGWKTCYSCGKRRDIADLWTEGDRKCDLCVNRPASIEAGRERQAAKAKAARERLSPAEKYRRALERSGEYTSEQIEAYVARYVEPEAV